MSLQEQHYHDHSSYSDAYIEGILSECKTIAMVGASATWNRPSNFAMKYLQSKGYRVIPVNPAAAAKGEKILGEVVYASLADVAAAKQRIDMLDVFRNAEAAAAVTEEALSLQKDLDIKVLWLQLGVFDVKTAARAEKAGLRVVMDRCPKIEYSRLFGELGLHGFDSGVISSRRRRTGPTGNPSSRSRSEKNRDYGFETKMIHSGAAPDPTTGARSTPIYQTTAYVFDDTDHAASLFNLQSFGNIRGSRNSLSWIRELAIFCVFSRKSSRP